MGEGPIPYVIDLTRYSEVRIERGMDYVATTPEHFIECMSWLLGNVETDAVNNQGRVEDMRHSTQEERKAYERMREENTELRELVELMWQTHCGPPTAYGWIAVMEEAEKLGINLEYPE